MSYRNPYQGGKAINTSASIISKGFQKYLGEIVDNHKEKQKESADEAEAILEENRKMGADVVTEGFKSAKNDINKFVGGVEKEDKDVLHGEITNALDQIGNDMTQWGKDNPEATTAQLLMQEQKALNKMKTLQKDLAHLNLAREEYEKAKLIAPGKEGSIVPNYNPHLIKFFEAQKNNDPNMHLTIDDNDHIRFSILGKDEFSGDDEIEMTFDATNWSNSAQNEGRYFKTVKKPNVSNVKDMIDKDIKNGQSTFGKANKKGVITYDKEAIQDYLTGQGQFAEVQGQPRTDGITIMDSIVDTSDKYGNWMYMGEDIEVTDQSGTGMGPTMTTQWSNNPSNFNEEQYREGMLGEVMNLFPTPPPPPPPLPSSPSSPSESEVTESVDIDTPSAREVIAGVRDIKAR